LDSNNLIAILIFSAVSVVVAITLVLLRRDRWIKKGPRYYRVISAETGSPFSFRLEKRHVRDPRKTWHLVRGYITDWEALDEYERLTKGVGGSQILISNAPTAVPGAQPGRLSYPEEVSDDPA
jgi:hypothetical protein